MRSRVAAAIAIFVFCALSSLPSTVRAGFADGSSNLICAVIEAVECQAGEACFQGRAADINLPQFFHLRFDEMTVVRKTPEGDVRTSKIDNLRHDGGELILQGVEEGLGWSLLLDEELGRMTLTASSDDLGYLIFGACTPG